MNIKHHTYLPSSVQNIKFSHPYLEIPGNSIGNLKVYIFSETDYLKLTYFFQDNKERIASEFEPMQILHEFLFV